jgi:hypothetical protein
LLWLRLSASGTSPSTSTAQRQAVIHQEGL